VCKLSLKKRKDYKTYGICGMDGFLFSLLLHIGINNTGMRMIVLHFGLNMGMALWAFGWSGKKHLLENWLVIYMVILFLGGIMEWEERIGLPSSFFWVKALIAAVLLSFTMFYLMQKKILLEHTYRVEIVQAGKSYFLNGYWDSGNLLTDPYIGAPVNIVAKETADLIFAEERVGMRLIPYRSLGCEGGLLPVYSAQKMFIYQGDEKREVCPVVLGIAKNELLEGKEYDVILQASMIEG